ncbi:MAG: hypothetical protein IPN97_04970 [Saprospiraceae bacterium]|nr:hypothetical protein [Saprospiraceae bacterium]
MLKRSYYFSNIPFGRAEKKNTIHRWIILNNMIDQTYFMATFHRVGLLINPSDGLLMAILISVGFEDFVLPNLLFCVAW